MNLFEENRNYQPTDPEILSLLGSREKQAQMRHHGRSPVYYRLGRKIIYQGSDLNNWANSQRIESPMLKELKKEFGL
jgi:hypothetical protein